MSFGDLKQREAEIRALLAAKGERAVEKTFLKGSLDCGDWDELHRPLAAKATGLRSYAHTKETASDEFSHTNDPITGHADWSNNGNGSYTKTNGSRATMTAGAGTRQSYVCYDVTAPVDVSVELDSESDTTSGKSMHIGPCCRMSDASTGYRIIVIGANAGAGNQSVYLQRFNSGSGASLAGGTGYTIPGETTIRVEAVGDNPSVSLVGYYINEATTISVTDDSGDRLTSGDVGMHGSSSASYSGSGGFADNWRILVLDPSTPSTPPGLPASGKTLGAI
jgi:hypothetical protein